MSKIVFKPQNILVREKCPILMFLRIFSLQINTPSVSKKCSLSFWYKNSPFSKILFSSLVKPQNLSLVSLERVESWLSNDTKLNFFGSMRPEKIIFEKGEFLYQKESGHFF